MKDSDKIAWVLVALSAIVPAVMISVYLFPRALPWWMDGGDWLKRVNAILGNTYPMWNQGTYQYPPLFMLITAALSLPLGEVLALKIAAVLAFSLIPLTTYFFVKELFEDRVVAVASAWVAAFTPIWYEMLGWGGYPDLLGLAFLPVAFLGAVRFSKKRSAGSLAILVAGSSLVPLAHHLTFLTYAGVLGLWGLLALLYDRPALRGIAASIGVTAAVFVALRLVAGPSQFISDNQAALTYLVPDITTLLYMFKNSFFLSILYFLGIATTAYLFTDKATRGKALLLASWTIVPIIFSQGYLLGISLDYNRILFFFAQPLMILVAVPLMFRGDVWALVRGGKNISSKITEAAGFLKPGSENGSRSAKQFVAVALLAMSLFSVFSTPVIGFTTMYNVNSWYNGVDVYGDQDKLLVANYLAANTPHTAVIVAETTMGRWIEGISQRRVLFQEDPRYLFIQGELAREYAAYSIYFSHQGERNGYAWVLDQAPYGPLTPVVKLYNKGAFYDTAYLNESTSTVSWVNRVSGLNFTLPLANATARVVGFTTRTPDFATIGENYTVGPITVEREVSLGTGRYVNFTFQAVTQDPSVDIKNLAINLEPVSSLGLYQASVVSNRTLQITTTNGNVFFSSSSDNAFPFTFSNAAGLPEVSGTVSIWGDSVGNITGLFTYTRPELIAAYGVTDVVIPKFPFVAVGTTVTTTIQVPNSYKYILADPEFKIVFSVSRALVLKVQS